jgi:hypothetical protein
MSGRFERFLIPVLAWLWTYLAVLTVIGGDGCGAAACFCIAQMTPDLFDLGGVKKERGIG